MTATKFEIRAGSYYDSVILMHLQRALLDLPGVSDAGVVMATPANMELLELSHLLLAGAKQANPEDLLIVVRAESEAQAAEALAQVDDLIAKRRSSSTGKFTPKSLEAALKMSPEAHFVLVSIPGRYAAEIAKSALRGGRHVFLYSDNVSIEEEVELKRMGRESGLLVMGPDCGTSIVNGVGLGFANRVRRGSIGLVGAAGTGMQAITSRIHELGEGISHAIGTGGRDLHREVGGVTALQALDFFLRDDATEVVVIVSKPPNPEVASKLLRAAQRSDKPVVVNFMGYGAPADRMGNLHFATNFDTAASLAVELKGGAQRDASNTGGFGGSYSPGRKYVRGLFSGGSLANEALRALEITHTPVFSNIATDPSQRLADPLRSKANTVLDLGEDEFTVGRLHPMMDNDLRLRLLAQEAADPEVAVILLDVVLGEGAHPDPASELAPAIADVRRRFEVAVVVVMIGTEDDLQGLEEQRSQLTQAGAEVFANVIDAVYAISRRSVFNEVEGVRPIQADGFTSPVKVVNVGLETFYESMIDQGVEVIQVDWKPPAGGNEELMSILKKMRG